MTDPHMSPEERAQFRADFARLLGPVGTLPPSIQLRPPTDRLTGAPKRRAWYWRVVVYGAVVYALGAGGIVAAESAGLVPNPHIPGIPGPITFHHDQLPIPTQVPPVSKTHLPSSVKISAADAKTIVVHYIESMRHTKDIIPPVITGVQLQASAAVEQRAGAQRGLSTYLWAVSFRSTDFFYTHGTMWVNTQTGQIQIQHFPPSALPSRQ